MQHVRGPFLSVFRAAAGSLVLAICAAAPVASAQTIYKWVDERGVVNYGNADVPKTRQVSVVDTTPPVTAAQPNAKPRDTAVRQARLSDADMLREELMRSREEVARLRQNAAPGAKSNSGRAPEGFAAWRETCEQQHRLDCNEATYTAESQSAGAQPQPAAARQPLTYLPKPALDKSEQATLQVAGSSKPAPKPTGANLITTMQ
jgi:hypothetical protein